MFKNNNLWIRYDWVIVLFLYFILALMYTYPGIVPLIDSSMTEVLSDGSDPVILPYQYNLIIKFFKSHPMSLMFGSIFVPSIHAPYGANFWGVAIERIQILFFSMFFAVEQISTAIVLFSMMLNGLFMFLFCRILNIDRVVSFLMGFCWSISAYTCSRAVVHMGLVGIYHLPMMFLSLHYIFSCGDRKSLLKASLLFLTVSFMPSYYVIVTVLMSPFFATYSYILAPQLKSVLYGYKRFVLAVLPAALWLTHSIINPVPSNIDLKGTPYPTTGAIPTGYKYHPFLDWFGSHPMDYLSGDLYERRIELNPVKTFINDSIKKDLGNGNLHERSNGIRWSVLILAILAVIFLIKSKLKILYEIKTKILILFFLMFGLFSFLISLAPVEQFYYLYPSVWIHWLVSQIRVPSRAGIGVHFALLIIVGLFLNAWFRENRKNRNLWIMLLVCILYLDFPSFGKGMPTSQIFPTYQSLKEQSKNCGLGMPYPYSSGQHEIMFFYYLVQRLRDTDCNLLSFSSPHYVDRQLLSRFALTKELLAKIDNGDVENIKRFSEFANCVPLNWVSVNGLISGPSFYKICENLGWSASPDGICINPDKRSGSIDSLEKCLKD